MPILHQLIVEHRAAILARTRGDVSPRTSPEALNDGVSRFLDHLGDVLRDQGLAAEAMTTSAGEHGRESLRAGLTVAQVVHVYGDVARAVIELSAEMKSPITPAELCTLNGCVDAAIAEAVTAFARRREQTLADERAAHLAMLAHELRNQLSTAMLAFETLQAERAGVSGSTGAVLARSLRGLREAIAQGFSPVRVESDVPKRVPLPPQAAPTPRKLPTKRTRRVSAPIRRRTS